MYRESSYSGQWNCMLHGCIMHTEVSRSVIWKCRVESLYQNVLFGLWIWNNFLNLDRTLDQPLKQFEAISCSEFPLYILVVNINLIVPELTHGARCPIPCLCSVRDALFILYLSRLERVTLFTVEFHRDSCIVPYVRHAVRCVMRVARFGVAV